MEVWNAENINLFVIALSLKGFTFVCFMSSVLYSYGRQGTRPQQAFLSLTGLGSRDIFDQVSNITPIQTIVRLIFILSNCIVT